MEYDLEIVVPISSRYPGRIDDFKKYGVFNAKKSKVLVTLILSGEQISNADEGWPEGIKAQCVNFDTDDYVSNVYRYFLDKEPQARWTMRIDDDSCTDVEGLIKNLDSFYDSDQKFYLGSSLSELGSCAMHGPEVIHRRLYREFFGDMYLKIKHEIECCVISHSGLKHIFSDEAARKFMKKRCELSGGAIDVALAFASSISKLWPVDLPFASYLPEINNFSTFGGYLNHIHMTARSEEGENFQERCGSAQFTALVRSIDDTKTKKEAMIEEKKFIMETENDLRLYEFRKDRSARIKFDERTYIWVDFEDEICLFADSENVFQRFSVDEDGNLIGGGEGEELVLRPMSNFDIAK